MFSIITMAASTIAPIAMAIPPSDMMLAPTPCCCMMTKAARMPIGRTTIATSEERRCSKKSRQTSATASDSSISFSLRVLMARLISPDRSYVTTSSTPFGRPAFSSSRRTLTRSTVSSALLP